MHTSVILDGHVLPKGCECTLKLWQLFFGHSEKALLDSTDDFFFSSTASTGASARGEERDNHGYSGQGKDKNPPGGESLEQCISVKVC